MIDGHFNVHAVLHDFPSGGTLVASVQSGEIHIYHTVHHLHQQFKKSILRKRYVATYCASLYGPSYMTENNTKIYKLSKRELLLKTSGQ